MRIDGIEHLSLSIPGGVVKLNGLLVVPGGGDAVFQFDDDKSLIFTTGRGYMLKPTMLFEPAGLDWANNPHSDISFGCGDTDRSLFQSFPPTLSPLAAVELRLRTGGAFPAEGIGTTVVIRAGGPAGAELGMANAFIDGPRETGAQLMVRYNFAPAIAVMPGDPVVIEWLSPLPGGLADAILTWMGRTDDPFPAGTMFGCGEGALPENDLNFRTFTSVP